MSRIPDEIIQRVRDHSDVVELVGRTVTLKRAGRNYKGLCPFHDEKTPSFNVNPDRQSYYCFGCQEGGDAFSFLMKTEGLSFGEAVRTLARDCGIEVPVAAGESRSDSLYEANELLVERYAAALTRSENPGAAYLAERRCSTTQAPNSPATAPDEPRISVPSGVDASAAIPPPMPAQK